MPGQNGGMTPHKVKIVRSGMPEGYTEVWRSRFSVVCCINPVLFAGQVRDIRENKSGKIDEAFDKSTERLQDHCFFKVFRGGVCDNFSSPSCNIKHHSRKPAPCSSRAEIKHHRQEH